MALTDNFCRKAPVGKHSDGGGLNLNVMSEKSRLWQQSYRFKKKQKTLSFGPYPVVSLAVAREKRAWTKALLADGRDPRNHVFGEPLPSAPVPADETFAAVAWRWYDTASPAWVEKYAWNVRSKLRRFVIPRIGARPIAEIEPPEVLALLRAAEATGVGETVLRVRQIMSAVFRFAVPEGLVKSDPSALLASSLKKKPEVVHHKKVSQAETPELLDRIALYDGEETTRLALMLTMHTTLRTTEVRFGRWDEIDGKLWRITGKRMKKKLPHIVPLTPQVLAILARLRELGGGSPMIAPGERGKPMSENTMLYALYRMGYHGRQTVHAFRNIFSTEANESGLWNSDWIELQLAHVETNQVRAAYNDAKWLKQRTQMMAWWSDRLDAYADQGKVQRLAREDLSDILG